MLPIGIFNVPREVSILAKSTLYPLRFKMAALAAAAAQEPVV